MNTIKVFHFNNGSGGGVLSVIKNLLKYSQDQQIENHVIYTINRDEQSDFKKPTIEGAASEQVFYYSPNWNFYHSCRQLAKLLPDDKAVVVAHDWLELGMMSNLGLQNPVVHFIHGDYGYYYELAKRHAAATDVFIAVAENIKIKLMAAMARREKEILYLRFPVPDVVAAEKGDENHIVFAGRLEAGKGYPILKEMAARLQQKGIHVQWHICGAPSADTNMEWDAGIAVQFYGQLDNEKLLSLFSRMQLIVLPSHAEGMPVVLIEAMKAGAVPVVNDIEGGIQELVLNDETGYKISGNNPDDYVNRINNLLQDKNKLRIMQRNCTALANRHFDPVKNTGEFEAVFEKLYHQQKRQKPRQKTYGSRLDQTWIPNTLVNFVRKFSS